MSHDIALITDTTCDIPLDLKTKYTIHTVPLYIIWGKEQLSDQVQIDSKAFYTRLPQDAVHPSTSQPTPGDFIQHLEEVRDKGAKEVVIMTISSKLSGTYSSAQQAAKQLNIPVHVFDSKSTSMGLGWQVLAAARARETGADAQGMLQAAQKCLDNLEFLFVVDTLIYLHRGGRIGGARKLVGMALQIKPQLYVDHKTGEVAQGERARTRSKAVDAVVRTFSERLKGRGPLRIAVVHGSVPEEAEQLQERVQQELQPVEIFPSYVSPVLGVHTGPRTLGLAGYADAQP